jgi:hypothetical protein
VTTTVRSVRVELDAGVDSYIAKMKLAGRETDAAFSRVEKRLASTNRSLGSTEASLSKVSRAEQAVSSSTTRMNTQLGQTERALQRNSKQLDTFTGRTGLLLKLAAGLGPALLPIAAIGVPALAGLAAEGGFAAGALGASVLALRGVGDGIKALEKARLDPTVENMQKAQTVLRRLGPDAAELVLHLDDLTKVRDKLQTSAASGLIPGLNEALDELQAGVPMARRLVHEFGDITGDILARGAGDLTSNRWTEFFNYLRTDARPILNNTADSVGHVAHALASFFTATGHQQIAFSDWLRSTTEDFDHWASRLHGNQDFQDFLAYANENGPRVADALGSIVEAFAAIVEAAAPLGGPVLQIITALADVIGSVASSPLGTPIFTAISAYSLLSTVLPGVKKGYEGISVAQGKVEAKLASGRATLQTFSGDLLNVARYGSLATDSSKRLRTQLGPLVKAGAGLAGLAIATSGIADGMGLSNTASMALIGTLAGPWGAAVLGAVGLVQDFRAESKRAGAAEKDLQRVFSDTASTYQDRVDALNKANAASSDASSTLGLDADGLDRVGNSLEQSVLHPLSSINYVLSGLDGSSWVADLRKSAEEAKIQLYDLQDALVVVSDAMGHDIGHDAIGRDVVPGVDQLVQVAQRAEPAMQALGITLNDLADASPDKLRDYASAIADYNTHADSAAGRTEAVAAAIASLDDELVTTAQSAQTLKDNLDALLGPQLGLSAATDAWTTALRHLGDDLDKNNRTLKGNSDAAIKNRAAIRDRVGALTDTLVAEANAGATSQQLSAHLRAQRQALIEAGHAAGISKQDMRDYLDTLGLTPALVRTLIKADTSQAESAITAFNQRMDNIHDGYATIHVTRLGNPEAPTGSPGHGATATDSAGGGTVPKSGRGYADRYPYMLADGEEIISNRHGQADRFRADRASGRIPGYADGGTAGDRVSTYVNRYKTDTTAGADAAAKADDHHAKAADRAAHSLKGLEKAADKVKASYEKEKSKLDDLISQRDSLASSISSAAIHDPFGNGVSGLDAQVSADTNDIEAMTAALAALVKNGLDPKSALYQQLAASMDVNTAQQLAQLSRSDLAGEAARFQHRADEAGGLGTLVANQSGLGAAIEKSTRVNVKLEQRLHSLEDAIRDLKHIGKHVQDGAEFGAARGAEAGTRAGHEDKRRRTATRVRTGG